MRLALAAVALVVAVGPGWAGSVELLNSIGPWRIGVLHNRMDDLDTELVSNVKDEYGVLTFGFQCRNSHYDSIIYKKDSEKIFDVGSYYDIEWRFDKGVKTQGKALATVATGLEMQQRINIEDLFNKEELLIRVYVKDRKYDAIFPLQETKIAMKNMKQHCN